MTDNVPVWDDAPWTPLPRLEGDVTADVCVVGLGGSGLSAAGELLGVGASVVGIDAGMVGGGAAGRNGGFLLAGIAAFHHDAARELGRERAARIYRLTIDELERIAAETPDAVRRTGSLRVAASADEAADCDAQLAAMRADGLPVEPYEGPEGRGLLFPLDASFQPLRRCRTLATRAIAAGARLFEHSPAVSISGAAVATPAGTIRCGAVIVAVDGRLERLLPELEGRVRTARLQMLATGPAPEVSIPRPVYSRYGYEYWQQLPDGRVTLGGFRDHALDAEWTHAAEPTDFMQSLLERFLRETIGVRATVTHRWAASVGYSSTLLPVLDEVRPRVWAAGGYRGTGNVVGALCGRAAAQLALTGTSPIADALAEHPADHPAAPTSAAAS
ncbi:MAG TPA: FAD-dependent oxidoreductase [Longimicrobiaceae bacterium]|jgi:glycine/D-amino acid oxidase-like deaminating enzyme|nr:FAD-dependent oxidoreductase [Longimicrobiaceae bacterium]